MANKVAEHIVLVGFMGVGKSTIASLLAQKLNRQVIDTDEVISTAERLSISEIFASKGEVYFREKEKELIRKVFTDKPSIISTGGGLPCFNNNMDIINNNAVSVKLQVGVDRLVDRLVSSNSRPLIANMEQKTLKKYISGKLKERNLYYNKATLTVRAINDPQEIADRIIYRIKELNR